MVVGCGLGKRQLNPSLIPVSTTGAKPRVWLWIMYGLMFDDEGFLTSERSSFSIHRSTDLSEEPKISYDYIREPTNKYQAAHIHVDGEMAGLPGMVGRNDRKEVQLVDLHLPVGGKRFRPGLEDLIEFLVLEDMALAPRADWQAVVGSHRSEWHEGQLKAAVRSNPEAAAAQLRLQGYSVTRDSSACA